MGDDILIGGLGNDQFVHTFGEGSETTIFDEGGDDVLVINGVSSADAFPLIALFGIGDEDDDFGGLPDAVLALSGFGGEVFEDIFFESGTIETFIFVPDVNNPEQVEVLTEDELFGDFGFGFGDPGLDFAF